ncbi:hypothetical protein BUE80_DR007700 [Diplocarpon rosae]|nr:hypothetical protein BUE80_DR007700 [Diplocarpon rosae]
MAPLDSILEMSRLPEHYQSPLQQIIHFLTSEPTTTRLVKISHLQDIFQALADATESPDIPSSSSQTAPTREAMPTLLPRMCFPPAPVQSLPALTALPLSSKDQLPLCPDLPLPGRPSPDASTITSKPKPTFPNLPSTTPPTTLMPISSAATSPTASSLGSKNAASVETEEARPAKRHKTSDQTRAAGKSVEETTGISERAGQPCVPGAVDVFQKRLSQMEITEKRSNQIIVSHISAAFTNTLIQFFFDNTFGNPCRARILELVDQINNREGTAGSAIAIAQDKALDNRLLPEVQEFFSTFALYQAQERKLDLIHEIARTIRGFELYQAFMKLKEKAAGEDGEQLRAFLETQGLTTKQGRDIRSCILTYLTRMLKIDKEALSTQLQKHQGVYLLERQFGKGILVLLPKGAAGRIQKFGAQKMQHIIPVLFAALPEAVDVCRAAEYLIPYITSHTDIALTSLQAPRKACQPDLSLAETLAFFQHALKAPADAPSQ